MDHVRFFYSSDVKLPVRVYIEDLEGLKPIDVFQKKAREGYSATTTALEHEFYISGRLYAHGKGLALPSHTPYRCFAGHRSSVHWGIWLTFPVHYCDIPKETMLALTIWDVTGDDDGDIVPVGGATIPLFDEHGALLFGKHRLDLWPQKEADGSFDTTTPYRQRPLRHPLHEMEQILNHYHQHSLPRIPHLDKLVYRRVEKLSQHAEKHASSPFTVHDLQLTITLPVFKYRVVYQEDRRVPLRYVDIGYEHAGIEQPTLFEDTEWERDNPIEDRYFQLARTHDGDSDRDLKPNIQVRDRIRSIITSTSKHLSVEEKNLLWRFRFALTNDPKALVKFLRGVHWNDVAETRQAIELMNGWKTIDMADALELLSPAFQNAIVREYAVKRLKSASGEQIDLFLLQLVQALKFEHEYPSPLSMFLIQKAMRSPTTANNLYWYVRVEEEHPRYGTMYANMKRHFLHCLASSSDLEHFDVNTIRLQETVLHQMSSLAEDIKASRGNASRKQERMRSLLKEGAAFGSLATFSEPIPLPVYPSLTALGVDGSQCSIFRSGKLPMKMSFRLQSPTKSTYDVIFKTGDDLRQDQLIIQMIRLMDQMLKRVNLDLRLKPYRVLATSRNEGFVELVPNSYNLSKILDQYNSIVNFFQAQAKRQSDLSLFVDNFKRSAAGYSVITYILGIGDRHLDNILIDETGHLFHIDFGFILGRDPKPFPAKIRIIEPMIAAMGGAESPGYAEFLSYCTQAYSVFRKNASIILNLLSLMCDSGINDLSGDTAKTINKVHEKFRLDLTDEEADLFLINTISDSVKAFFPQVTEYIHKFMTDLR